MLSSSVLNPEATRAPNEQVFPSISETIAMGGQTPQQLIPQDITSCGLLCAHSLSLPWILLESGSQKCSRNPNCLDSTVRMGL